MSSAHWLNEDATLQSHAPATFASEDVAAFCNDDVEDDGDSADLASEPAAAAEGPTLAIY